MAVLFISLFAIALGSLVNGQSVTPGQCPDVVVKDGFDARQYLGGWYGISKIPAFYDKNSYCDKATYSFTSDDKDIIFVNNTVTKPGKVYYENDGKAYAPDPKVPAKLIVNLDGVSSSAPFWILDTDYSTYTVVYSCTQFGAEKAEFAWVMSRKPAMDANTAQIVEAVFKREKLSMNALRPVVQKNCVNY